MLRSFLLAWSVAMIVLVFAPIAAAQTSYRGAGNQGMDSGGMNDRGTDDNMMASPTSSASASTLSSASGSASASTSASASASATGSSAMNSSTPAPTGSMKELPDTGGIPLMSLLSVGTLLFLASSGVFAARLMRRIS
jgi:hypothetical protein